jgi:SAM-dependent methyltransferase
MIAIAARNRLGRRLQAYEVCRPLVEGARAIEIGGPSAIFARGGMLPLYPLLERLDNCDFTEATIWHGEAAEGNAFHYDPGRGPGRTLIRDATSLDGIDDESYGAVLSSHTLEHVANPLRALAEWERVLRVDGCLALVLPHFENTFDHRRPVTTLEHLETDFASSVSEDDDTHLQEFIEFCDLARVPEPLSRPAFEQRTRDFVANRTLHHHVFDTGLAVRLLDRAGFELLHIETALPFHIVTVARRSRGAPSNDAFLSERAEWRRKSVFRSDRRLRGGSRP